MLSVLSEATQEPERDVVSPNTCEYKGVTYYVMTDFETGKCFIDVDGVRKYLDCRGVVANKQPGSKSVKTAIENFDDMKKIQDYFLENHKWNFYLLYTLNINTGRRISDLLQSRWSDFFYDDGTMRRYWSVMKFKNGYRVSGEQKTGKGKDIYLNAAVKEAFHVYLEHEPEIDIKRDYDEPVFKQLHGAYKGRVISAERYRQMLNEADKCIGYDVTSHSMRRGMGKAMMELHPNDPKAKSVLMEIFNHSSEKMTNKYIGESAKLEKEYFEDFGDKYVKYVMHGEEVPFVVKRPVSVYDNSELRKYMMMAFATILDNKDETDPLKLMKVYNNLLDGLEEIAH